MRPAVIAAILLIMGIASPASAVTNEAKPKAAAQSQSSGEWYRCFDLGWVRGVHIEQNELPGWMEECMAGQIPFDLPSEEVAQKRQPQIR